MAERAALRTSDTSKRKPIANTIATVGEAAAQEGGPLALLGVRFPRPRSC